MQQSIATGPSPAPDSVRTENGMAEFHRDGPASVTVKVANRVPDNAATLQQSSLAEGVEALCKAEIEKMQATLAGIAETLADQLSDEGRAPFFTDDSTDHRDRRTWDDRGSSLLVDASITAFENQLDGFEDVADAQLVRASIDATIRTRENSIRNIYKQILVDVSARRGMRTGGKK